MTATLGALETALWGILTFSILVVLHELGHFLAARAFGVKVHEFMVGLPGPSIRLHTRSMDWGVTAIPLGGYVRIAGMEPGDEDELTGNALAAIRDKGPLDADGLATELDIPKERAEALISSLAEWKAVSARDEGRHELDVDGDLTDLSPSELADSARKATYRGQPTWKRIVILAMGVVTNLTLAILTMTTVLAIWGYFDVTTTLAAVTPGSAAEDAGLVAGDVLVAIDDRRIDSWDEFQMILATSEPGSDITVTVKRGAELLEVAATLTERDGHGFLGVGPEMVEVRPTVFQAFGKSIDYAVLVLKTIMRLFDPSTFPGTVKTLTGPVGVSVMAADAAEAGPLSYAGLVALLSLSLGLMNLLPLPPLDGGKIVIEVVERVLGRPLSRNLTLGLSAAGAVLLFSLIGYVMYLDIVRYAI